MLRNEPPHVNVVIVIYGTPWKRDGAFKGFILINKLSIYNFVQPFSCQRPILKSVTWQGKTAGSHESRKVYRSAALKKDVNHAVN